MTVTAEVDAAAERAGGRAGSTYSGLDGYEALLDGLRCGPVLDPEVSLLVEEAVSVWSRPGFESLVSLPRLRFTPFDHQLDTARTVLRQMHGRAILADEVGLGKTIEAGLVLSELRLRGLADRALVLAPPGLVEQWREELDCKFALPSIMARTGRHEHGADGPERPVVLASLAAACRDPLRHQLSERPWDMVIADEAHRLRRPRSASGRLARLLRTRYLLLLTATPVENRLDDLFELVSLVSPGLLGTAAQFRRRHGGEGALGVRHPAELRSATREVMIRHRRDQVALMLPSRLAETLLVPPSEQEGRLYADVVRHIRDASAGASPQTLMGLRTLTRLAGSSPAAVAPSLRKRGWDELADHAEAIPRSRKAEVLLGLLNRHLGRGEKVIVFTGFQRTLETAATTLAEAGIPAAIYSGSLSRQEKEGAVAAFRGDVPVLLSTEAAGEGRNLQFCHVMVNLDVPWNPMQIEQRLGRLHRIGQEHDVVLTNLVGQGTVEEQIVTILEKKINLFELVVGELDMILGRVNDDFDFETSVFEAFVTARDDAMFAARLEVIGDSLARARTEHLTTRGGIDDLVGK